MNRASCPDDLLVAARRGTLGSQEARALAAHLATCAECRMSVALGRAGGPLPPVDDADEAMAARLVARALAPRAVTAPAAKARVAGGSGAVPAGGVRQPRARLRRWSAVAAGLALTAGVASAAVWTGRRFVYAYAPPAPEAAAPSAPSPKAPPTRASAPVGSVAAPALDVPAPAEAPPAPRASIGRPGLARASTAPPAPLGAAPSDEPADAAALFQDANDARRAHRTDDARRAYETLQARFPSSPEAVLSHLSLGNLELARGTFAAALAQFDAYVASGAELGEEALLGKAKALAGLGRAADERETWRALEARYPTSEYRWRARQRLGELGAGDAP